jgi:XRE family aerobic/anaerobic benzoate catabolism transcriptional regulator
MHYNADICYDQAKICMIVYLGFVQITMPGQRILAKNPMATNPDINDIESGRLLGVLGERVRTLRTHRRMTRKVLAHDSGVSERYLAQLEQGRGNISIRLLARVAAALRTDISDLLSTREKHTAEELIISDLLRDLSPDTHKAFLQLLSENFAVPVEARRRIALIGLRGAGKTSQGQLLSKRLDIPFVHLGSEIELLAGMSTSEIFSLSGQTGYRRLEEKALMQTLRKYDRCVLETGGSIVTDPNLLNTLLTTCFVVWLHAEPEEYMRRLIAEGDVRPMENQEDAMADLRRILSERNDLWGTAHVSIDTNGKSIEECVTELVQLVPEGLKENMQSAQEV